MAILETCKAFLVSNSLIFTGILVFLFILWLIGIRFIPNNKVGIIEKVIASKKNKSGGIIALNGETGFQADVLRGGIYIYPRFFYKIHMVNIITIPQGEIGYAFARDGKPLSSSQTLGRIVKSDSETVGFEDVRTFLNNDGQKGPQRLILREGTYAINLAQFIIITNQTTYYMSLNIPDEKKQIQDMSNLIRERNGFTPLVISDQIDSLGIVTVHDGPPIKNGEIIAPMVEDHDKFQNPQAFIDAGGYRGRQLDVLTDGTYFINALFATVEIKEKLDIPIGQVGVVNYFTGEDGEDLSGEGYDQGNLVAKGQKGVWEQVLEPGKYPWNPYAGKVYKIPTSNFLLQWEEHSENEFNYDSKLQEINLITSDAFQPSLPLSVVIRINPDKAAKVIQRFGEIKTLVEGTLDPLVGAYFKDVSQQRTLLEFINSRSDIQKDATEAMKKKFAEYDLTVAEVIIGTPQNSKDDDTIDKIYKQLQDRQLAKEEGKTFEAKKDSQLKQQEFVKAKKSAEMQEALTASEMEITITDNKGKADVKHAEQAALVMGKNVEAAAKKTEIEAKAAATKVKIAANAEAEQISEIAKARAFEIQQRGDAEANTTAKKGIAEALGVQERTKAVGANNIAMIEVAKALSEAIANFSGDLVPKTSITMGEATGEKHEGGLFDLLLLKLLDPKAFASDAPDGSNLNDNEFVTKIKDELLSQISVDAPAKQDNSTQSETTEKVDTETDTDEVYATKVTVENVEGLSD